MSKKRVKVGRRLVTLPSVKSMTDRDAEPAAPAATPDDREPEKPTTELSEELTRMVKAAYQ